MEFSIVENSIHISPEENQNVNNRDINSYCVINVNNLGNSELNVNETPFVSTSLVEPFIDIKPTKSPTKIYSIDEEYSDPILVKDGGRKRQKVNRKLAAKLAKHQLQTDFIISCKHNDKSSLFCKVFEISLEDIKNFKFKLCSETSKIEQDKILISYMWIIKPKRTNRRTDLSKNDRLVVKYFIPLKNEKKPVCAKAFSDITGITRRRLNILSNSFRNFHTSPKEKRGGARVTLIDKATTVSITHHIQQFKAKKSHYSRKDSDRCYLQPNLSLSKMYNLWTIEMKRTDQPIASIGKYKTIFYKHFNLSFGHPRLDVCSHCTELKAEINAININAIQKDLLTNKLSLHKEQSKHFHRIMKLENKNTINIAFDMMQNQPIPKLSVTEVFYSRQVWVYNLTFVLTTEKQIPQNCHMYTWTETESGRGPNEVGSALIHFLKMLEDKFQNKEDAPTVVNLFSDSCSGLYVILLNSLQYLRGGNPKRTIAKIEKIELDIDSHGKDIEKSIGVVRIDQNDEVLASELLDIENMEFSIVENSIHISPEENQNVNNRDINSYCVINVNNLGNSELNVNETPFVSTSLVEPFIDIKPTKSPTKIYSIDEEYSDPILVKDGGRKRQKVNRKLAAKLAKHQLQTDFIISCKHNDKSSLFCKVFEISLEDIKNFKFKLCSETSKIEQDKILISYMWIIKPKRTNRRTDLSKNDRLVVKYFIPLKNEKKPVCAKAFSDITGITRRRLNILSNSFRNFHTSPKEKRGGARVTLIDKATTVSITHHIQQFKAKKSHYSRKDSDRCYLQPNLSLSKMYNLWTIEMKRTDQPIASIGKYKTIFYKHFNLSFGHPRLDVCSHCTELKAEINAININAIQKDLLTNKLSLHKEQSKHFHRIMKLENKNTINIAFDMMQNQPIPKLSVTEVFYSRQVWVYNLTFVLTTEKQIPQNCHMYTWTETESGRGPNEVGSALIHFLKMLEDKFQNKEDAPTVVNLFSDSCSGQNKNQFIMAVLLHFINFESKIFSDYRCHHIFNFQMCFSPFIL
ncbi:hypothetical protein QTP88_018575 [Uroleucon formosanum]